MMKPVLLQLASNFISRSMRAGFAETVRINVSVEVIESYRKSLNAEM